MVKLMNNEIVISGGYLHSTMCKRLKIVLAIKSNNNHNDESNNHNYDGPRQSWQGRARVVDGARLTGERSEQGRKVSGQCKSGRLSL